MSSTRPKKILMIVTSHEQLGDTGKKTGFWLEELAAPYQVFHQAGALVDIASPKGGKPPLDPKSESSEGVNAAFTNDPEAVEKLANTLRLDQLSDTYDAYFVVGGHGAVWDLAESEPLQLLLAQAFDGGRVIAAVCHGPAALVRVKRRDGDPLVKGKRVTGFSDEEEAAVGLTDVVPFTLEARLRELGGRYQRAAVWTPHAERDGRLVTGQNPASSTLTAQETLKALENARS